MNTTHEGKRILSSADFGPSEIDAFASRYGLVVVAFDRVGGYEDANFVVESSAGEKVLLKLSAAPDAPVWADAEARLLDHINSTAPDVPTPRLVRTRDGECCTTNRDGITARVHTFLPGTLMIGFRPRSSELRLNLGDTLGRLNRALLDFDHPFYQRTHDWVLETLPQFRSHVGLVRPELREFVDEIVDQYDRLRPRLEILGQGIVHADVNDHNLLVSTRRDGTPYISGVVDFGDAVHTVTIADLAIACAYAMLDEADPVTAACDVVAAYHTAQPLVEDEIEVLYPLMLARLALSTIHSTRWRAEHGDSEYHLISERSVANMLGRLREIDRDFVHHRLRHACGLPMSPASAAVTGFLRSRVNPGPVLPAEIDLSKSLVFDLSVTSDDPGGPDDRTETTTWTKRLFDRISRHRATAGIGRYEEPRICYRADQFVGQGGEPRTVHLGMDVFAPPGTPVLAPLGGRVHSFRDNALSLDYGPTVIIEHRIEPDGIPFFTLYGHLSRSSLGVLSVGLEVESGFQIGRIGATDENGGWPPHVHFQLITHLYGNEGNFPGVAPPSQRKFWTEVCPDPNLILGVPRELFPSGDLSTNEIRDTRTRRLSPNLSLSYRRPLHIVRGYRQFLYDVDGLDYLDCVNNVAHVGHCHPRVVATAARQMAVLNTNTRYLHENIVRYAERLVATLPDPLSVCFLVNSGSEANDLALRLAKAHTGSTDVIVLGSAYHGNLSSLIDISPYKAERKGGSGLPAHVHRLEAPDVFRGRHRDEKVAGAEYAKEATQLVAALKESGRPPAAFVAESALGCAGQIFLPDGYLKSVFGSVRAAGGVCIVDEVQVGFGRVGSHFWAFELQGVVPDIVTMGKPIGNAHPLGAVVTTREIADSFDNGMEYFNTFGGNPVSCAIGLEVLNVIRDEKLQQHAASVGSELLDDLRELQHRHPIIGDVRGAGLFIGIELVRGDDLQPAAAEAAYLVERMRGHRILLSTDGPDENVIKFKPPMVFSRSDARRLVETMDIVLNDDFLR